MTKYTHTVSSDSRFHNDLDFRKVLPVKNRDPLYVKPTGGFWLSIDNGWERWCSSEWPEILSDDRYAVTLKENAKVLTVRSPGDLAFLPTLKSGFGERMGLCILDFEEISRHVDVLEIYARSNSELYDSFYGWDCDSALVLNPDAIESAVWIGAYIPDSAK